MIAPVIVKPSLSRACREKVIHVLSPVPVIARHEAIHVPVALTVPVIPAKAGIYVLFSAGAKYLPLFSPQKPHDDWVRLVYFPRYYVKLWLDFAFLHADSQGLPYHHDTVAVEDFWILGWWSGFSHQKKTWAHGYTHQKAHEQGEIQYHTGDRVSHLCILYFWWWCQHKPVLVNS